MDVDEQSEELVKSIINLGHNLRKKVVAEGVETEEHMELLRTYGCDYVQGYYYAPPLGKEESTRTSRQFCRQTAVSVKYCSIPPAGSLTPPRTPLLISTRPLHQGDNPACTERSTTSADRKKHRTRHQSARSRTEIFRPFAPFSDIQDDNPRRYRRQNNITNGSQCGIPNARTP